MDALSILRQADVQDVFRRHSLVAAFLFGSRARGEATEESDVDLAVLFPCGSDVRGRFESVVALDLDLRSLFPVRLDLISLNDASPLLQFEAVIGGITVYAPDPDKVLRYEFGVRHRYEDFCHIQDIWMRGYRQRLGVP